MQHHGARKLSALQHPKRWDLPRCSLSDRSFLKKASFMKRHPQWARRLHQLVVSSKAVTFAWGIYDCGQFAARAIREMTGVDVAIAYRGKYTDEASAEALFLNGHPDLGSFAAAIASANGMPEILPVTFAQRGDVVWVDNSTQLNPR